MGRFGRRQLVYPVTGRLGQRLLLGHLVEGLGEPMDFLPGDRAITRRTATLEHPACKPVILPSAEGAFPGKTIYD